MSAQYLLKASGCDDETCALIELTGAEVDFIRRISDALNERSTYGCQPTLHLKPWADASSYEREAATDPIEKD